MTISSHLHTVCPPSPFLHLPLPGTSLCDSFMFFCLPLPFLCPLPPRTSPRDSFIFFWPSSSLLHRPSFAPHPHERIFVTCLSFLAFHCRPFHPERVAEIQCILNYKIYFIYFKKIVQSKEYTIRKNMKIRVFDNFRFIYQK
jgi:hypothetical protein